MSPWRVLFSIDAWRGLMPPVPSISVRFLSSAALKICTSICAGHSCAANPGRLNSKYYHVLLFGSKRRKGLMAQHVEAREHADRRDERRRQSDTGDVLAGKHLPRYVQGVTAHAPGERDRAGRSDQTGQRSQDAILEEQHGGDCLRIRTEGLEDRGLVNTLELRHRDRPDENQHAAEQDQPADNRDGPRHFRHDIADRLENVVKIDHGDVWKAGDQIVLELRTRCGTAGRPLERRNEGLGGLLQRAGPEDEHEAPGAGVLEVDIADAGDLGVDRPSEDVEPDNVAEADGKTLAEAFFNRDFRFRRRSAPERACDDSLVLLEVI